MDTAIELPIQSPNGERIVIDRTTTCFPKFRSPSPPEAASLAQLRSARACSSLFPRQTPGLSSKISGGSLRELKLRRLSQSFEADRQTVRLTVTRPKKSTSTTILPKSFPTAAKRKSEKENKLDCLRKKDTLDGRDKTEIAPEGLSAGREGRQFTVANVGNNGRIYLRPSVRSIHLRSPQPNFVFPIAPPDTTSLDIFKHDRDKRGDQQRGSQQQQQKQYDQLEQTHEPQQRPSLLNSDTAKATHGSDWATDYTTSPTALPVSSPRFISNGTSRVLSPRPNTAGPVPARPSGGHRRAVSDLTVQDTSFNHESESGGFKVVITQHTDNEQRAKMLENPALTHTNLSAPHIDIAFPTWKLGTPHFGILGTPTLRNYSNTPTEGPCSRRPSYFDLAFNRSRSHLEEDDIPNPPQQEASPCRQSIDSPTFSSSGRVPIASPASLRLYGQDGQQLPGVPKIYHSKCRLILPSIFDVLTFRPGCDDRTIVRMSPATNAITAATPARLVAEITSPRFMDYELVSDFFLTYRSFLDARELLCMLIARLKWAVARDDEIGMVVRVRTFVALRHWILNYFMDDFVVNYDLRVLFCDLLNSFVDELAYELRGQKVQLKILTELKKCWRRSCAQFWDGHDFEDSVGPEAPIAQGDFAEHGSPKLRPRFWKHVASGTFFSDDNVDETMFLSHSPTNSAKIAPESYGSCNTTGDQNNNMDPISFGDQLATSRPRKVSYEMSTQRKIPHMSITSLDVVSCSFPTKNVRLLQASTGRPLGAHPTESPLACSTGGPVATTPRALTGKRVRPSDYRKAVGYSHQHERSKSLTDSLRERAPATDEQLRKRSEATLPLPHAGSLVRGALFPPGQPYVGIVPPSTSGSTSRQTTLCQPFVISSLHTQKEKASAMSSQGMRKLLDSVRRALSTKGQVVSSRYSNVDNGSAANRLPITTPVPHTWPRQNGFRGPLRIDLLGARIAEDFKVAVRESAKVVPTAQDDAGGLSEAVELHEVHGEHQASANVAASPCSDSSFLGWTPDRLDSLLRPMSEDGMTAGSKNIVSAGGMCPRDYPEMTGALAFPNSSDASVDAFRGAFLSPATDPTPPTTPPDCQAGTPRRSSYTLGQQVVRPSLSMDPVPMFIPDTDTLGDSSPIEPSDFPIADISIRPSPAILPDGACKAHHIYSPNRLVDEDLDKLLHEALQDDIAADKNILFRNSFGMSSSPPIHRPRPSWIQGHSRHLSSRSRKSHLSHTSGQLHTRRRFASFASGVAPETKTSSFNASTYADAFVDNMPEAHQLRTAPVLRRRPGGDLRAVANVGGLNAGPIRRSRSVGSLTSYSESLRNSFVRSHVPTSGGSANFTSAEVTSTRDKGETFSVGMLTNKKQPTRMSHLTKHLSKPVMRPSFDAEAKKLSQIPDDVDDDGGVESALLKLEALEENTITTSPASHQTAAPRTIVDVQSFLTEGSGNSHNSLHPLDQGPTDGVRSTHTALKKWTNRSVFEDSNENNGHTSTGTKSESSLSALYGVPAEAENNKDNGQSSTVPQSPRQGTDISFLKDESDDGSDLSSELSAELSDNDRGTGLFSHGERRRQSRPGAEALCLPVHPVGDPEIKPLRATTTTFQEQHPGRLVEVDSLYDGRLPSPPMTLEQALQLSPDTAKIPELHDFQLWEDKPLPPTPSAVGNVPNIAPCKNAESAEGFKSTGLYPAPEQTTAATATAKFDAACIFSVHLPFILAFDSEILAQQFTLIEKDALHEIDWKELINMRWKKSENGDQRSWVNFLRSSDARGVEVVIARFNIMVKWTISEIILTQDLQERARCIIKFIHVAAHCRRYRNFATMSQIAIALTTNEVSRLTQTWALVPPGDLRTLRSLETLVSPTRNFHSLRAEMETVDIDNANAGCIPFVGVYTHDLLFNAQKPSEIASSPTTAPLVNFERCRIAASIVKTLLRLIEASTIYAFRPVEGIVERCLWMSALTDDDIRKYSDMLK
ncbi:Guanine nucleotide exchange factor lte1 [Sporothrix epigloea]|uniref:Guanine nucleotide exchange factor lte1 n=1 Tax=Sporothrix epigloea TaxID=1892477 RepID=A0ABP0E1K6_9PEZI